MYFFFCEKLNSSNVFGAILATPLSLLLCPYVYAHMLVGYIRMSPHTKNTVVKCQNSQTNIVKVNIILKH